MYIFGLTMQDREPKIPKEVADWIKERMAKYPPEVDFQVDYSSIENFPPEQREPYEALVKKYSRSYNMRGNGVMAVTFPYLNESWYVKIMCGADKEGNILNPNDPLWNEKYDAQRTNELRNEIAGLPSEDRIEKVQEANLGEKRREDNPALNLPKEYEEFKPGMELTSEVAMSGELLSEMVNDPAIQEELNQAFAEKDWNKIRELKNRKIH
jgi:hypothetical protein